MIWYNKCKNKILFSWTCHKYKLFLKQTLIKIFWNLYELKFYEIIKKYIYMLNNKKENYLSFSQLFLL